MAKLQWDQITEKEYQSGVEQVAVYPIDFDGSYEEGAAWNGISAVNEEPTGGEPTALWANNKKYLNLKSAEEFAGTIEAYMKPKVFAQCDGNVAIAPGVYVTQQTRKGFGLAYKTGLGNDTEGLDFGYELHLVWGAEASPTSKTNTTTSDSPEAATLSWSFTTTPVPLDLEVDGKKLKAMAHMIINSTEIDAAKLKALEDKLYGTTGNTPETSTPATLPSPEEVVTLIGPITNG